MPIYEYKCLNCGNKFDTIRLMKDADEPIDCQVCQSMNTQRTISVFFAQSSGRIVTGTTGGSCSSCSGGSCSTCGK